MKANLKVLVMPLMAIIILAPVVQPTYSISPMLSYIHEEDAFYFTIRGAFHEDEPAVILNFESKYNSSLLIHLVCSDYYPGLNPIITDQESQVQPGTNIMLISKPFIPPFVEEYWIAHFMLTVMEDSTVIYFFEGLLGIMRQQRTEEHREALLAVADAVRECAEGKDPEARDDLTRAEENTRYAEAALRNPNRQAAIRFIERAVGNLEKAVMDEILEEEQGILFMLDLMFIARSISIEIVDQAIAHPNGDEDAIFEAQMALAEGDSLGYSYNPHLTFMKAVDKYRDALIKAESILLN